MTESQRLSFSNLIKWKYMEIYVCQYMGESNKSIQILIQMDKK